MNDQTMAIFVVLVLVSMLLVALTRRVQNGPTNLGAPNPSKNELELKNKLRATTGSKFAVIDVETTGLSADRNRVIEIGVWKYDIESGQVATANALLNHDIVIPRKITEITGIHRRQIEQDGFPPSPALTQMLELIADCDSVWAYNADFDSRFLQAEAERLGVEPAVPSMRCILKLTKSCFDLDSYKLGSVCKALGVHPGNSHRAQDDATAAGGVLMACAFQAA